jgi:hypothetical protein
MLRRLLDAYRAAGADLPFGDPARAHGTAMEGYYWRIVDPSAGSVIVALCGVCRRPAPPWATVALAGHPVGVVRHAIVAPATADPHRFGVRAAGALCGSADRLSARLAEDAWVELRLRSIVAWPRSAFGALGLAHAVPGLAQYWHPVVLAARVEGEANLAGVPVGLDGATAYVEKNWGPRFPGHWWWGHADSFAGRDVTVAFAGGRLDLAGQTVAATAAIVRLGTRVLRFAPPLALVRAGATVRAWRVRAGSLRYALEIEADAAGAEAHLLPVPDLESGHVDMRSTQYLAGRLRLRLSRGERTVFEGESQLAGLERGVAAGGVSSPRPGGPRP